MNKGVIIHHVVEFQKRTILGPIISCCSGGEPALLNELTLFSERVVHRTRVSEIKIH